MCHWFARSFAPQRSSLARSARSFRSLTHRHRVLYVHPKPSLMGSISSRKCSPISESLFREFASRKTDLAKAKERATGAKWSERSEVECGGVCQRATSAAERTSKRASGTFSTVPFQIDLCSRLFFSTPFSPSTSPPENSSSSECATS